MSAGPQEMASSNSRTNASSAAATSKRVDRNARMAAYRDNNNNDEDNIWNETLGVSRSQGSSGSDGGGGNTKPGSSGGDGGGGRNTKPGSGGGGVGVTWSPGVESPRVRQGAYLRQGLTLVHFSAQREPFYH